AVSSDADAGVNAAGVAGAALPSAATDSAFSDDSVAVSGQSGQVSPMAGVNIGELRDRMQAVRAQNGGREVAAGGLFGAGGGESLVGFGRLMIGGGTGGR